MELLSQAEVAKRQNVSRTTVSKWVEMANEGKNGLQVQSVNSKVKIFDNPHNDAVLMSLTNEAKKYKNNIPLKESDVDLDFYNEFSDEEIVEIYSDLKFKQQIKHKYVYKKPQYWNNFYLLGISPVSKAISDMLNLAISDELYLLNKYPKVNLIDIGPGNAYPVKGIINKFKTSGLLNKYIAVDISKGMLSLAYKNILDWFNDIDVCTYERDVETSRFGKIFLDNKSIIDRDGNDEIESPNLILYLDGLCNLDDRVQGLKNIRSGMTDNDLLVVTFTLDTNENKGQLNYIKDPESTIRDGWHLNLLGVDIENCTTSVEYDAINNRKDKLYTLDKDYLINIKLAGKNKKIKLNIGEKISTWRHYLLTIEQFISEARQAELEMVNLKMDKTYSYALATCRVKYKV